MKIRSVKQLVLYILVAFLLLQSAYSHTNNSHKTVKVGYYYSGLFQEGLSDDEIKTGFAYEYLQKVSEYCGWTYTYFYDDWATCLEKLQKGEIDILAGVSYTQERSKTISYPQYYMGTERYYLYQNSQKPVMDLSNPATMNGKIIGTITNNRITDYFLEWADDNNLKFDIRYYGGFIDRSVDYENGKLDGIVSTDNNILTTENLIPVVKVGEDPYYLAVTKKRPDLLADLNNALVVINELEPYYLQNLQSKSYSATITSKRLSQTELDWLETHKTLRVGYLDDYLPYSKTDLKGNVEGLIVDVFDSIVSQLSLENEVQIEYISYKTNKELVNSIHNHEIDAAFPIGGSAWYMEKMGLAITSPVVTSGIVLVYKGSYSDSTVKKIAINRSYEIKKSYVESLYPDAEIIMYDTIEECIAEVAKGNVNSTIVTGLRIDLVLKNNKYNKLNTLQLDKTDSRYIALERGNYELLLLLNRGLKAIGRDFGINASYSYLNDLYRYNFKDFIVENATIVVTVIIIISLLIVLVSIIIVKHEKANAKALENYLFQLETAKKDVQTATYESTTDELTGFFNRRAYEKNLANISRTDIPENLCLISIDVNGLKTINDTLGHSAGDELIVGACYCMNEIFGIEGKLYRVGGDEFIIIIAGNEKRIEELVKQLRNTAKKWQGNVVSEVSLSIGYAFGSELASNSVEELQNLADRRMYEDKSLYYSNRNDRRGNSRDKSIRAIVSSFVKILKIDLATGTYQVENMIEEEKTKSAGF